MRKAKLSSRNYYQKHKDDENLKQKRKEYYINRRLEQRKAEGKTTNIYKEKKSNGDKQKTETKKANGDKEKTETKKTNGKTETKKTNGKTDKEKKTNDDKVKKKKKIKN